MKGFDTSLALREYAPFLKRYGPADTDEITRKIIDSGFAGSNVERKQFADRLAEYPLSHDARAMRVRLLRQVGEGAAALEVLAVGIAIYPESVILCKMLTNQVKANLTPLEKEAIFGRIPPLKNWPNL